MSTLAQTLAAALPAATSPAPALPVEGPIVTCALHLRNALDTANLGLAMLQYAPRDSDTVAEALRELRDAADQAATAYGHYHAITGRRRGRSARPIGPAVPPAGAVRSDRGRGGRPSRPSRPAAARQHPARQPNWGGLSMLRLVTDNGQELRTDGKPVREPVREPWRSIPDHTLVTITLPREDVDGLWYGYGNMMEAFSHMLAAMNSAKAGEDAEVTKRLNRAMGCLALTSSFARDVYERAKESAERTNRRRSRKGP